MTLGLITSVLSLIGHARNHLTTTTTTFAPPPPPPFQPFPPPFQAPPFQLPPFEPPPFQPPPVEPPPFQTPFEPPPPSRFEPPQPSFDQPPRPRPRAPPPPPPPENTLIPLPDDLGPPTSPDFIPPSRFDSAPPRPPNPVFDESPRSSTPAFESLLPPPIKGRFNRESRISTTSVNSNPPKGSPSNGELSTNLDGFIKDHIASQLRTKRYATSPQRTRANYSKKRKNSYNSASRNRVQHVALPLQTPSSTTHEQDNAKPAFMTPPPPISSGDDSGKFSLEPFPAHSNTLVLPAMPLALENPKHRTVRQAMSTGFSNMDIPLDGVLVGPLEPPDRLACLNRVRHSTLRNHAYFFPWEEPGLRNLRLNWLAARNFCRRRCMDLMSLETAVENMLIREKIMRSGKNRVWTSGRLCDFPGCDRADLLPLRTNGWFWAASSTRIVGRNVGSGFQDWANSPSTRANTGFPQDREACVVIGTTSASSLPRWMEMACQSELEFVCEDSETLLRLVNVT